METKTCKGPCGRILPLNQFYKTKQRGRYYHQSRCKPCFRLQCEAWEKAHPEHREVDRAYAKRARRENPEKFRLRDLKQGLRRRGTTLEEYQAKLEEQHGTCAICGQTNQNTRRLAVDHSHQTGANRGLLCDLCNQALERLETIQNWDVLARQYLEKHTSLLF